MVYDALYGIPVDVIRLGDLDKSYSIINAQEPVTVHIANLDRKTYIDGSGTYISRENFETFFAGSVNEKLISVSRAKTIGDVAPLTIGTIAKWDIYTFCREELE